VIQSFDTMTLWVTLSFIVVTSFSLFLLIYYSRRNKWLYLTIPIMLVTATLTYVAIEDAMGYPTPSSNVSEQIYVSHIVGINKEWIYVWSIELNVSTVPRAYRIVYTKENEKKLAEAKQRQAQGLTQGIVLPGTRRAHGTDKTLDVYTFNKLSGVTK